MYAAGTRGEPGFGQGALASEESMGLAEAGVVGGARAAQQASGERQLESKALWEQGRQARQRAQELRDLVQQDRTDVAVDAH
jgi:hypothetical protein